MMLIIGSGEHCYQVSEGWAQLPQGMQFGYTHGIDVDSEGNIYVFHTGPQSVAVFDREGSFMTAWGEDFEGGAHGFYIHKGQGEPYMFLTDTKRRIVVKCTMEGKELLRIGTPDLPEVYDDERKFVPTDVAVGPNGDIYIADGYGQSWIHQYDSGGGYIRSWGGKGSEPGQLNCPHGISVDMRRGVPELYVADRGNHRIQVFSMNGEHLRFITGDLKMPCSFYFHGTDIYIPDLHSRLTVLDEKDKLILHLGDDPEANKQQGWPNLPKSYYQPDRFSSPHGVCVDSRGDVYVAEWISDGRITKLIRQP
jgi:DNA-binding beta-propeller fold protein YncE